MFIEELMRRLLVLKQWDEQLILLVEKAIVRAEESVEFVFTGSRR